MWQPNWKFGIIEGKLLQNTTLQTAAVTLKINSCLRMIQTFCLFRCPTLIMHNHNPPYHTWIHVQLGATWQSETPFAIPNPPLNCRGKQTPFFPFYIKTTCQSTPEISAFKAGAVKGISAADTWQKQNLKKQSLEETTDKCFLFSEKCRNNSSKRRFVQLWIGVCWCVYLCIWHLSLPARKLCHL